VIRLNAKELRGYKTNGTNPHSPLDSVRGFGGASRTGLKRIPIYIILDNVLDTYNVGAIFRLADAVGAKKVILCGETQIPPNSRIKKASINTTEFVDWEYCGTALRALKELKKKIGGIRVIVVEQSKKAIPYTKMKVEFPVAVVVGNETYGVSKEVLEMADEIVEIPMFGVNKSLNVMVSLGIVLYEIMENI